MMLCASLCCSSVMVAEKDASEAIRSVVATLTNIQKLKPEQEQCLFLLRLSGFVFRFFLQLAPLVVKELAKANASDWLCQIPGLPTLPKTLA